MDDVRVRRIVAVPEGMPVVKLLKVLKRRRRWPWSSTSTAERQAW